MRKAKTAAIAVGSAAAIISGGVIANYAVSPVVGQADPKQSVEVYDVKDNVSSKIAALTSIRSTATNTGKAKTTVRKAATVNASPAEFENFGYAAARYIEEVTYAAETTEPETTAPTEAPTAAPTEAATEPATEATTAATAATTEAPTEVLTDAPTEAATESYTEASTAAPTTEATTEAETESYSESYDYEDYYNYYYDYYYEESSYYQEETTAYEGTTYYTEPTTQTYTEYYTDPSTAAPTTIAPTTTAVPATTSVQSATEAAPVYSSTAATGISDSDYIILCNAVAHEAGSNWISAYDKALVVEVIMNRVNSSLYPNSISGVLTQPYQFTGASSYVYLGTYSSEVNQGVKDAVNLYFSDPSSFSHGYYSFWGDGYQNHFS